VNAATRRRPAVLVLLTGLAIAAWLAPGLVGLLRDRLHYLCSEGGCHDGVSYLAPVAIMVLGLAAVVGVGLLAVSRVVAWSTVRAAPRRYLALVSVLPSALLLVGVLLVVALSPDPWAGRSWSPALTTMVVLLAGASDVAVVAAIVRRARTALVCSSVAVVALAAAVVAEPGSAPSAAVSIALLVASLVVPTPHPAESGADDRTTGTMPNVSESSKTARA
jgi:hypothetical protein